MATVFSTVCPSRTDLLRTNELPLFRPILEDAEVHIPAVEMLNPAGTLPQISLYDSYIKNGIGGQQSKAAAGVIPPTNAGEVFANLKGRGFDFPPDKGGGIITPSINVSSLSRKLGPLAGKADDFFQGVFAPLDFFDRLDATLLGILPLSQLIQPIKQIRDEVSRIPQFLLQKAQGYAKAIDDAGNAQIQGYLASVKSSINTYLMQLASWTKDTYDKVSTQWDGLAQEIDTFSTTWEQIKNVIGPELDEHGAQNTFKFDSKIYSIGLVSHIQTKSKIRAASKQSKQSKPIVHTCPTEFYGVSVYPLDCIQEQVHAALLAEQTIARSAAQELESRLKASRARLDANQKVLTDNLVSSLAHMRTLFAQVLTAINGIPDGDIRDSLKAIQGALNVPSLNSFASFPQLFTDLWNALQRQAARLATTTAGVGSAPEAECELLLRTLSSLSADLKDQEVSLKNTITDRFDGMRKEALDVLSDIEKATGKNYSAIRNELDQLHALGNQVSKVVSDKLADLKAQVDAVRAALEGAKDAIIAEYRQNVENALRPVTDLVEKVRNDLLRPVELKLNYDFAPAVKDAPSDHPVFRASLDGVPATMEVHILLRQALNPLTGRLEAPSQSLEGFVRDFQIVLLPQLTFLTVKLKEVSFKAKPGQSVDVHIQISKVEFGDCLSFVKALVESLPFLGNKGNGPFLDITTEAVTAGYRLALGKITLGGMNIFNVAIEAGVSLSLSGAPMTARFSFCSRARPFLLSAGIYGGGGFFAIEATAHDVILLEGSFEFGGVVGLSLGPASGLVTITAGIYFSIRPNRAELAGFFQVTGDFDIAHIIHMSLLFYMGLSYVSEGGSSYARGQVTVHVSIEIGFFLKVSYDIHSERTIAGSGGNAKAKQLVSNKSAANALTMTNHSDYALDGITEDIWEQYSSAFAS